MTIPLTLGVFSKKKAAHFREMSRRPCYIVDGQWKGGLGRNNQGSIANAKFYSPPSPVNRILRSNEMWVIAEVCLWPFNTKFFHAGSQSAGGHAQYCGGAVITFDFPLRSIEYLEEIVTLHFLK